MSAPLEHPYADPPAPGEPLEVAPGVFWIAMPLPFAPSHVNLWMLADGPGWTIVDTGLHRPETLAIWERAFAALARTRPVTRLVCTHFHPDHLGAAGWLLRRWNIELWMTAGEWWQARAIHSLGSEADVAQRTEFYRASGVDAETLGGFGRPEGLYRRGVPEVPSAFRRIEAGRPVVIDGAGWQPIIGRGHSPEHACLWSARAGVMIVGDILLPRITPNIGVWPAEPLANPLAEYLGSLDGFAAVPDETLVLPSHGLPYRGVRRRVAALREHHAAGLDAVANALAGGLAAVDCFALLFKRPVGPHNIGLAVGEALAHLHLLEDRGRARRRRDGANVWRFEPP